MITRYLLIQQNATSTVAQTGNSFWGEIQWGTFFGVAATLSVGFGVWYLNKRNLRIRLRRAVVAELKQQEDSIQRMVESLQTRDSHDTADEGYEVAPSDLPPPGSMPTTIYESNASNLGELPSNEVEDIVSYYSSLQTQKATIVAIRNDETVVNADKRELHNNMPDIDSDRKSLISKLEDD